MIGYLKQIILKEKEILCQGNLLNIQEFMPITLIISNNPCLIPDT